MTLQSFNYRLVTRSDFDGLVSAALLRELQMIDDISFVHPKDMQDGLIEIYVPRHYHKSAVCRSLPSVLRSSSQ